MAYRLKHLWLCPSFLALSLVGCGLADYEAKMAEEQARVRRIEEENKNLEDPVDIPSPPQKENDKDPRPPDFFFRPPKGIGRTASEKQHLGLFVFPKKGNADGIQEVYVGFSKGKKDFVNDLIKMLPGAKKYLVTDKSPWGRDPIRFDTITIEDPKSTLILHTLPAADQLILIGFRLDPSANLAQLAPRLDMSLESIGLGIEAGKLRKEFRKRSQGSKAPSATK
jgi:hypothetical protein